MNRSSIVAILLGGASVISGCAATVDGPGPAEHTDVSAQSLTLSECTTQRASCLQQNPLFGLFVCPAQYVLCAASANNGLPVEVNSAISDATACTRADLSCTNEAFTPAQLTSCATTEAECVASILQVHLPTIVAGTASCVSASVKCIDAAEVVGDLTTCANNLESCAVTQAQSAVPAQVGQVIVSVSSCQTVSKSCISAASTPAGVTQCGETDATCVAGVLGVTLPDVSIPGVVSCAETAANCALDADSVSGVTSCATTLTSCATSAAGVSTTPPPAQPTCEQTCLARNPLDILDLALGCGIECAWDSK